MAGRAAALWGLRGRGQCGSGWGCKHVHMRGSTLPSPHPPQLPPNHPNQPWRLRLRHLQLPRRVLKLLQPRRQRVHGRGSAIGGRLRPERGQVRCPVREGRPAVVHARAERVLGACQVHEGAEHALVGGGGVGARGRACRAHRWREGWCVGMGEAWHTPGCAASMWSDASNVV